MKKKFLNLLNRLPLMISIFGVLLATLQFFYNRSLWGDEAMLAYGIVITPINELQYSLPYHQIGPWFYLIFLKITYLLYPSSEMSIRLISILSYLGALVLFFKSIRIYFKHKIGLQMIGISLFVFNNMLIYYASELKHYSTDVLVSSFYLYALLSNLFKLKRGKIYLIVSSILAISFSGSAPIVLPVFFLAFFVKDKNYHKNFKNLFLPGVLITLFFILYYFLFLRNFDGGEFMQNYWSNKEPAFMPLNLFSSEFAQFFYSKKIMLFEYVFRFGFGVSIVLKFLFFAGLFLLIKEKRSELIVFIIGALILHLAFSSLKLYPFHIRFCLYLIPGLILLFLNGLSLLCKNIISEYLIHPVSAVFISLFLFGSLINFKVSGFPFQKEEVRKTYAHLIANYQTNDVVLLSIGQIPGWSYYTMSDIIQPPESFRMKFLDYRYVNSWSLAKELKVSERVWVVSNSFTGDVMNELIQQLGQNSYIQESVQSETQSDLYLFRKDSL